MRNKKSLGRILGVLALVTALLAGCSGRQSPGGEEDAAETGAKSGVASENGLEDGGTKAMGRYVETKLMLPEEMGTAVCWMEKEDGTWVLLDSDRRVYESSDEGASWELTKNLKEIIGESYLMNGVMAPDGSWFLEYVPEGAASEEEEEDGGFSLHPVYCLVSPDGETAELKLELGADEYMTNLLFLKDGTLMGTAIGGDVYRIDTGTGSLEKLFSASGYTYRLYEAAGRVFFLGNDGLTVYNPGTGLVEDTDKTLNDFVAGIMSGDGSAVDEGRYPLLIAEAAEEGVLYLACSDGLYSYVLGGSTVQQLADGSLCTMGNPRAGLVEMKEVSGQELAVLYHEPELIRYTYDPDVPAVPEEQIKIYSLYDMDYIRVALSGFQQEHPEVYIKYEAGLTGEDGMTAADALKNLNMELMSGEGPDILILDGMPMDAYIEKGMLSDVKPLLEEIASSEGLQENILDAYEQDGKIYGFPAYYGIPMLLGTREDIDGITDLKSLADVVERKKAKEPKEAVLGVYRAGDVLEYLYACCSGAWVGADGKLDEAALTEFLTQAKRIWQAEENGLDSNAAAQYEKNIVGIPNVTLRAWVTNLSGKTMELLYGGSQFAGGMVSSVGWGYGEALSAADRMENGMVKQWNGQAEGAFDPGCIAGISARADKPELAGEFFKFLFSREIQNSAPGLTVNTSAFEDSLINPYEDEMLAGVAVGGEEGELMDLSIRWPREEEIQTLREMASGLKKPVLADQTIRDAVTELGASALTGDRTVEEAVNEILKKVQLYLAE